MPDPEALPEPWRSFFDDLDEALTEPVALHCFGGFVLIHAYGVARTTNDIDFISLVPSPMRRTLSELGGKGSELHKKHRIYLDPVTVATAPDGYEDRLRPMFEGRWQKVTLQALEPHDLALAKLTRNIERDRDDIQRLARAGFLDRATLQTRYREELRSYLPNEASHDLTLELWMESCWPEKVEIIIERE